MPKEAQRIDITHNPELLRLAEEIHRSQEPRVLVREAEELVEVRPVPAKRSRARGRRADQNDWLLRLADLGAAAAPADRPTDVSANKHKYVAEAYYAKSHPSPRR